MLFNFTVQLCLPTATRTLTATNNLSSEAHFHYTVSVSIQVSVHRIMQHILFQYILPLSSTSKSLALYCNLTPKIHCTAGMPSPSAHSWALHKNGTRKCRSENVIHLLVSLCYIFKAKWTPSMTQVIHNIHCLLQCIGQLLIISSEFNIRGMTKLNL